MHEFTKDLYQKNMTDEVIQILNKRNISNSSIDLFEIGLSTKNYDELLKISNMFMVLISLYIFKPYLMSLLKNLR